MAESGMQQRYEAFNEMAEMTPANRADYAALKRQWNGDECAAWPGWKLTYFMHLHTVLDTSAEKGSSRDRDRRHPGGRDRDRPAVGPSAVRLACGSNSRSCGRCSLRSSSSPPLLRIG